MPSFISLYKLSSPGVGSLCRWSLGGSFTSRCGLLDWFLSSSLVGHIIYTHTLLRSLYCFIKARNHAQSRVDQFCRSLSATATQLSTTRTVQISNSNYCRLLPTFESSDLLKTVYCPCYRSLSHLIIWKALLALLDFRDLRFSQSSEIQVVSTVPVCHNVCQSNTV